MKDQATSNDCPRCAILERRIAELEARLARLEKNSGNSSKPPSSDIVKPPRSARTGKKKGKKRRKRGGQPGHPKHERPAFPPEQVDQTKDYQLDRCLECDGPLQVSDEPVSVLQQVEILVKPIKITEHRSHACFCEPCQREFIAPIPRHVRQAGLAGPRLTALVGYLKGACHCSFTTIHKYLLDVLGIKISRGQLRKLCGKVANGLNGAYEELLHALPEQERANVDETGHKENGQGMWTWCFRVPLFTLFKIDPSRGSEVLLDVLGTEFDGVLGCDYFSAYRKYMRLNGNVLVQFCLAHLIRDVKFLVEHPHPKNRAYGKRVLRELRALFALFHRRGTMSKARFLGELEDQGMMVLMHATFRVPHTPEARNLAARFDEHGDSYLRFITTPDVEPTNNLAEQAIRFVVIDRRVTQGTRSPAGRRWLERIWTAIATCTQQGKSVFEFLNHSVHALFRGATPPSLLFNTS
jgi:transposase